MDASIQASTRTGSRYRTERRPTCCPGYWIGGGGIDVGGGSVITIATPAGANVNPSFATWGGGIMFYNSKLPSSAGGPFTLNSNSAVAEAQALDVPTTDPDRIYNSIVIFQDRTLTTSVTLNGSASSTEVMGIVYVPLGRSSSTAMAAR